MIREMKDKILLKFGLVSVKKIEHITQILHRSYVKHIQKFIEDDFGVPPAKDSDIEAAEWWSVNFRGNLRSCPNVNDEIKIKE